MAGGVRTSRSRGSLCGFLLILLGGWAGIAPFAGPVLRFGYTPDHAWAYTQGRVYLSAVPAGVAVLAGLILMATRSRGFGGFCAAIAALAGGWLIAGTALIRLMPRRVSGSVSTGAVLGAGAHRAIVTPLAFFAGPGALIVFVAAVAIGRLSITAYKDYLRWPPADDTSGAAGLAGIGLSSAAGPGGYAGPGDLTAQIDDMYGRDQASASSPSAPTETYQAPAEQQYPVHDPFGLTQDYPGQGQYPRSQPPFPPAENPFAPTHQQDYTQQTWPQDNRPGQAQPAQDSPGQAGPGGRLERTYPPSDQSS
jgi:hypothetical protein